MNIYRFTVISFRLEMAFNETICGLCFPRRSHFIDKFLRIHIRISGEHRIWDIWNIYSFIHNVNQPHIQIKLSSQWGKNLQFTIWIIFSLSLFDFDRSHVTDSMRKSWRDFVDVHRVKITCLAYQNLKMFFFLCGLMKWILWWFPRCRQ